MSLRFLMIKYVAFLNYLLYFCFYTNKSVALLYLCFYSVNESVIFKAIKNKKRKEVKK